MSEELAVAEVTTQAPVIETPAPVETPSEPRSLDDTLAATMAEIKARRPEHGEDGKFIVKAGATTATPELKVPGSPAAAPPDPAAPVIEAPQSLPADVKAQWASLPPTVQKYWSDRESEIHKKITSDGERLKAVEAFDEALAPAREFIEQNRIPKPEYIRRLAVADHALRTNGPAALAEIARMYGINPGAAQQTIGQPVDPQFNALAQRQAALEQKLTQQEQAAYDARVEKTQREIDAFKKDAPHFDKVEADMANLYDKYPNLTLQELYDRAIHMVPEVRKAIEAEREAKAKADALAKQKADAAAAAKLRTLGTKPGSVGVIAKTGGSWEDTMAATHRGIRARG